MNLPNKLSIFRMILVPVCVLVKCFPYAQYNIALGYVDMGTVRIPVLDLILLGLFVIGSLSDFLDGQIARRKNLVTTFGKFIDPIADKMLTTTMFIMLAVDGRIPLFVVLVFVWRDIIVDGLRMIASQKGVVVAAGMLGKLKTVTQMFAIIFILLSNVPFEFVGIPMSNILLWLAVFLSATSGLDYYAQMKQYVLESK